MNKWYPLSLLLLSFAFSCGDTQVEPEAQTLQAVSADKADNFYSSIAAEYEATGKIKVNMSETEFADELKRQELIDARLTAVGLYLTTYMTEKIHGLDHNGDGEITDDEIFNHNDKYGGFQAMVRNQTVEESEITQIVEVQSDGSVKKMDQYEVVFTIDLAGPRGIQDLIPGTQQMDSFEFSMKMPKDAAFSPANPPRGEMRRFDPETHTGELETIDFKLRPHLEITNAYPHYQAFIEDGVYDLTLFFGYDYNEPRIDIPEAEEAYAHLEAAGYKSPVASFDALEADSGPFVLKTKANGKELSIEIRIFHALMFTTDRKGQHDKALSEISKRDVFFYNGHAGPYYGFYLDAKEEAKVGYEEFATYPMKADKQQLFVAQGCQTYSQYADMIYANPAKHEGNLDVITTVNYSYGKGTLQLLDSLIFINSGTHYPIDFYTMVGNLNDVWINNAYNVFYGVMGIDGNPQLHPYADKKVLGETCTSHEACGDGAYCVDLGNNKNECVIVTLSNQACPANSNHMVAYDSTQTIQTEICVLKPHANDLVFGITEGSSEANAILDLVNRADFKTLDDEVGLDRRAAKNIIEFRRGEDPSGMNDRAISTLTVLNEISFVGKSAFRKLKLYTK